MADANDSQTNDNDGGKAYRKGGLEDVVQQQFSDNVKYMREQVGLTVAELADKIDVHRTTIHRAEQHPFAYRTYLGTAYVLARALGCSLEEMIEKDLSRLYR